MATSSFFHDIIIDDENKAKQFIEALEKAEKISEENQEYMEDEIKIVCKFERNKGNRRRIKKKKDLRLRKIISGRYMPHVGWIEYDWINGIEIGNHIKYSSRSNKQRWIKKQTSKKIRKSKDVSNYNNYRRFFDYWHTMY